MITLARPILTTASLLALAMGTGAAQAAESCSAYPTGNGRKHREFRPGVEVGRGSEARQGVALRLRHQNTHQ